MHLKQISQASVDHAQENMKSAVACLKSTLKDGGDVSDDDDENDCDDEACDSSPTTIFSLHAYCFIDQLQR